MSDCMHVAADKNFPDGVTCRYYNKDEVEKCKGQLSEIKSWNITEGQASFWESWIDDDKQAPDHCANQLKGFPRGGSKFKPQGCRNAYYTVAWSRGYFPFKGFQAWD